MLLLLLFFFFMNKDNNLFIKAVLYKKASLFSLRLKKKKYGNKRLCVWSCSSGIIILYSTFIFVTF